MEKQSWVRTLATPLSLCFVVYLALNLGHPQQPISRNRSESNPMDIYFVSVKGGFRPLKEQTRLLKLMERVVKIYKAKFVVNISELGEEDPLMQNATWYFHSLKVPWYTTRALKGQEADYFFVKRIKIPYGRTLDVIALDTGSLQWLDPYFPGHFVVVLDQDSSTIMHKMDSSSSTGNDQLHWLTRTLEASNSNWHIVVGFHPFVACDENIERIEAKQIFEPLHHIFLKYGVACDNYIHKGDMTNISSADPMDKGPHFTTINQNSVLPKELVYGLLLHRVSSLEIVTYLVTLAGEVVHRISLEQRGREFM